MHTRVVSFADEAYYCQSASCTLNAVPLGYGNLERHSDICSQFATVLQFLLLVDVLENRGCRPKPTNAEVTANPRGAYGGQVVTYVDNRY
jgi:hypothetical protein